MTILCGTDFSEAAERAVTVAAHFAVRFKTSLHLVHAAHYTGPEQAAVAERAAFDMQLDRIAERARGIGAQVRTHIESGPPDEVLLKFAERNDVELIVVGALGTRVPGIWYLGSHAERLAQTSRVPLLVVRDEKPFRAWLNIERPLRVMLGADFSSSADAAAALIEKWRAVAPCEVTAVHLYWPPQEFARLGLTGARSYLDPDPEVTQTLVRQISTRFESKTDPKSLQVRAEPHLGRLGDRLADLAAQRESDLLVVGSRPRGVVGRLREGSVSHWALHAARTSVLCVPAPVNLTGEHIPKVRDVLVATDFSPAGNAAVGMAYALADVGGTVHLVHVLPRRNTDPVTAHDLFDLEQTGSDERRESVHSALRALLPRDAQSRTTRLYALVSNEPAAAICQAAARLGADAVCVGRRGRSNLAETLLGSVSREVVAKAHCPVLLVHAPRA
jgi:nucleotide-binding universal stress UspA family protein